MDEKAPYMPVFAVAYDNHCFCVYKKGFTFTRLLGIFVFMLTVKRFHIYGALLHLALKVFTFTVPYYIFTFRGATNGIKSLCHCVRKYVPLYKMIRDMLFSTMCLTSVDSDKHV